MTSALFAIVFLALRVGIPFALMLAIGEAVHRRSGSLRGSRWTD